MYKSASILKWPLPKQVLTYSALISQEGTNAPTAIILQNDFDEITWSRTGQGQYQANSTQLQFTEGLTQAWAQNSDATGNQVITRMHSLPDLVQFQTYYYGVDGGVLGASPQDDVLVNCEITIKTYLKSPIN